MSESEGVIKEGSIVLDIGSLDTSDRHLLYNCVGKVYKRGQDAGYWEIVFPRRTSQLHGSDLVWLMDLPGNMHEKPCAAIIEELRREIFVAALRQLRYAHKMLSGCVEGGAVSC